MYSIPGMQFFYIIKKGSFLKRNYTIGFLIEKYRRKEHNLFWSDNTNKTNGIKSLSRAKDLLL